jgi:hypothetical protein
MFRLLEIEMCLSTKVAATIRKPHECLIRVTGSHELIFSNLELPETAGRGLSGRRKSILELNVHIFTQKNPEFMSRVAQW